MNSYTSWATIVTPLFEAPREQPDGSVLQVLRVQGYFSNQLPLQHDRIAPADASDTRMLTISSIVYAIAVVVVVGSYLR